MPVRREIFGAGGDPTVPPEEGTLNKKNKGKRSRASWLPAALVAAGIAVLAIGAVWLSANPGGPSSGSDLGQRPYVGGDLHSIAVDPTDPQKVMVGGHDGGAISEDGGKTWEQASGLEGADPMGWEISPEDPEKMYAGGHSGFYRSGDGGENWEQDSSGLPGTDVHGLGMDPSNPEVLYSYVVDQGLYRSPDAGGSWELVDADYSAMGPILVDPRNSKSLYLAGMDGSFRKSEDGGESWRKIGTLPGEMVMSSAQIRKEPDTFYAAGGGVFESDDGGETWEPVGEGLPESVSVVGVSQSDPRIVYAGALDADGVALFRSEDGGKSWRARN